MDHVEHCTFSKLKSTICRCLEVAHRSTGAIVSDVRRGPGQHLGIIHRWAEHLCACAPIPMCPQTQWSSNKARGTDWIREAATLVATLRASDPDTLLPDHSALLVADSYTRPHPRMDIDLATARRPKPMRASPLTESTSFSSISVSSGLSPKCESSAHGEVLQCGRPTRRELVIKLAPMV